MKGEAVNERRQRPNVRRQTSNVIWWAVAGLLAVLIVVDYVQLWPRVNNKDLRVIVEAGQALARGGDIFADIEPFRARLESGSFDLKDPDVRWPYAYPPFAAILILPLATLPFEPVALAWTVANVIMLAAGGYLCLKAQGPVEPLDLALLGAILYAFYPAIVTVRLGQIEILQFLLLAGAFLALKRGRDGLAGGLLGVATALKLFPGVLIAFLFWKRLWRPAVIALVTALALLVGSFAAVGLDQVPRYLAFTSVYGRGPFGAFPLNQSLHGFFARNLTANLFVAPLKGWDLPWLADGLTLGLSAGLIAIWAWLTWGPAPVGKSINHKDHQEHKETDHGSRITHHASRIASHVSRSAARFDLEFGGNIALLLLVLPHSQVYAFVWLLVPLLVLAYQLRRSRPNWSWLAAAVAYALVGRQYQLFRPGLTRLVSSHVMFGALLLLFVVAALLWQAKRPTPYAMCNMHDGSRIAPRGNTGGQAL